METALIIAAIVAFCALIGWMFSKIDIGFVPACPETANPPRPKRYLDDPEWDRFYAAVSKKNGTKIDGEVFWLFKDKKFISKRGEYAVSNYELTNTHFIIMGNAINLDTGKIYNITITGDL